MGDGITSLGQGGQAAVAGSDGVSGAALAGASEASWAFSAVRGLSRAPDPSLDLPDDGSARLAAGPVRNACPDLRLAVEATGMRSPPGPGPEKPLREIRPEALAEQFATKASGPALLKKHILPLLTRKRKPVLATLSAHAGNNESNRQGGWPATAYRRGITHLA